MKAIYFLLVLIFATCLDHLHAQSISVLASGTMIPVRFSTKATSDDNAEVKPVVSGDVKDASGNVLIADGTPVVALTTKTPSASGKGGTISVTFQSTKAVDGQQVNLTGEYSNSGRNGTSLIQINNQPIKGKPGVISDTTTAPNVTTVGIVKIRIAKGGSAGSDPVSVEPTAAANKAPATSTGTFTKENINFYLNKEYKYNPFSEFDFTLKLKAGNIFLMYAISNGGTYEVKTGSFAIKNGLLELTPTRCYSLEYTVNGEPTGNEKGTALDCKNLFGTGMKLALVLDSQSLYYTQYIKIISSCATQTNGFDCVDGYLMGVPGTEVQSGESRTAGSNPVVTMGMKKATTNAAVKLRTGPGTTYSTVKFIEEDDIFQDEMETVPVNTEIVVIARSKNKSKSGNAEDYWYLVNIGYENTEVWVFGHYITFVK